MNTPQYVAQKLRDALQRHNLTLTEFAARFRIQWAKLQMLMAGNFVTEHIREKVEKAIRELDAPKQQEPASIEAVIFPPVIEKKGIDDLDKVDLIYAIRHANLPRSRQDQLISLLFPELTLTAA